MKIKNFRSKINLFVLCLVMQIIFFGCINDKSHDEKEFDVIKIDNGNDQKINVNEFSVSPPPLFKLITVPTFNPVGAIELSPIVTL